MFELIVLSLLIMLASLSGKLVVWREGGSFIERNLDYLVSFSAGVFLIFLYGLAQEAIEHSARFEYGVLWILCGAAGIWLVFKILPSSHVHVHEHGGEHAHIDARRLLFTDGIHNAADGIFLAASYAVSPVLAAVAALSIFLHEALQEISEFFVLRDAGYSTKQALLYNFLTSSTILIGAVGGYFLLDTFEVLEGPLLGIAAGGILIVVLHDLIPHSLRDSQTLGHYGRHLLWFVVGAVLMFALSSVLPHAEPAEAAPAATSVNLL